MTALFQIYGALDAPTEAALRASIKLHGVLLPVAVDQDGRVLDGHHRKRIAEELGVGYLTKKITVRDDDHAIEIARTLNEDRRQVPPEQRRQKVADLRNEGHSERAIAGALGVSKTTVHKDLEQLVTGDQLTPPERVTGEDGKSRPAKAKKSKGDKKPTSRKAKPAPVQEAEDHAPNLADELERADKQIRAQQELIESLQKDDQAKEVAKWKQKYDQLNGRVQQLATTTAEAQKTAQYQADLLAKIRKALKVEKNSEILAALKK